MANLTRFFLRTTQLNTIFSRQVATTFNGSTRQFSFFSASRNNAEQNTTDTNQKVEDQAEGVQSNNEQNQEQQNQDQQAQQQQQQQQQQEESNTTENNENGNGQEQKENGEKKERKKSEIEILNEKINEKQEMIDILKDKALRALADGENARIIAKRDVESAKEYGIQQFAKKLLPINDNLQRALQAIPEDNIQAEPTTDDAKQLKELYVGLKLTQKEVVKAFASEKIEEFNPLGEKFDPNFHEALYQLPETDKLKPNTVGNVVQSGYLFKKRVLRAAKVGVVIEAPQPENNED